MSVQDSDATMAVFLDLENIALGAHDADFPAFDIRKVLERLLLKGQIVVKKAYCDFERYKTFKRGSSSSRSRMCASPAKTPPTSAWSSMRSISVTPRVTSTRSSSLAAIRTFRRSSANCARTTRPSSASALKGPRPIYSSATATNLSITTISCAWSQQRNVRALPRPRQQRKLVKIIDLQSTERSIF